MKVLAVGVVVLAALGATAQAQVYWTSDGPLGNATVTALAINPTTPTTLYAGTYFNSGAALFESTNGGSSWSAVNTGPTATSVSALAINPTTPSTLYAGTFSGVFQSTNSGASWSAVNTGLTFTGVFALAINPTTPSTLYAGTYYGGVFQSTDSGASWSAVNTGLTATLVSALAINPTTPSTLYAGTRDGGVFESTNGGSSWSAVNTGLTFTDVLTLAINPTTPTTLYAGTNGGGVFESTNGGSSWSAANTGLTATSVWALAISPTTPSTLYAGTNGGVFESTNGGSSWSAVNAGPTANVLVLAINPTTPTTLYAGTDGGVFESTNGGSSWAENMGLNVTGVSALAINPTTPTTLYAGTNSPSNGDGVFESTNGGSSWVSLGFIGAAVSALAINPTTPTTLYAGTSDGEGVFESTNGGSSWSAVNTGLLINTTVQGTVFALAINPTTPSTLYAGTNGGVFQSTNGGGSWSAVNTGLTNTTVLALAINPTTPTTLYAGTDGGGVFESTNGGGSWSAVNPGLSNPYVQALVIDPTTPSTLYAGTNGGVFQSTDGGGSWSAVNTGLTNTTVLALAINPTTPSTLYAGTNGGGVFDTRRQVGSACVVNGDCPSGNCVDGICCDPSCTGTCQSCALAETAQPNGTCAPVGVGQQTSNSCNSGSLACNGSTGAGSCATLTAQGQACTTSSQCVTGNCIDGICCGPTCSGTCQSCASAETGLANGTCGPATGTTCDDGNPCTIQDQCLSGVCTGNPNHCGDGVVQASCGEQCDDGNTNEHDACKSDCTFNTCGDGVVYYGVEQCDNGTNVAGDGCTGTCGFLPTGLACQRALGKQASTLAANEAGLRQKCLNRIAAGTLACQAGECVLNPARAPVILSGSTCIVNADCCPDFDNIRPTSTTAARVTKTEATMEKAIRSACSLAVGPDGKKGTDDDVYIHPQTLGYDATCLDVFGQCGTIATATLTSAGGSNDLIACLQCTAEVNSETVVGFSYPLVGSGHAAQTCEEGIGFQAATINEKRLTGQQQCLDRTLQGTLGCVGGTCVVNPGKSTATVVSGSSCTVAGDCCPGYDAVDPTKTTAAKLTKMEATAVEAMKVKCSLAPGPDRKKGTNDDTYVDPSTLGFAGACLASFGQCGTLPTTPLMSLPNPGDDLLGCLQCTTEQAADGLVNFYLHPGQ